MHTLLSTYNSVDSIFKICADLLQNNYLTEEERNLINFFHVSASYIRKTISKRLPLTESNNTEHLPVETQFPISLHFNDVAITQQKNLCSSRLDVDISSEVIKGVIRPIPMIASNMSTVINADFYKKIYELGALAVLHRAECTDKMVKAVQEVSKSCEVICTSVGIGESQVELAKMLINAGANVIFIDVAHGYSEAVFETAQKIKQYSSGTKLVLGNTTNIDMLYECHKLTDGIKVGVGQGFPCETKDMAACTEGQFSAILKFKQISKELGVPVIGDGGIRKPADLVKAIAAGANSIMAGKIFAACPESAAEVVEINGIRKKKYAGMSSRFVQDQWKGGLKPGTCSEGCIKYLDIGEPVEQLLDRYTGALRSGITYSGAQDINSFQQKVKFVQFKSG